MLFVALVGARVEKTFQEIERCLPIQPFMQSRYGREGWKLFTRIMTAKELRRLQEEELMFLE